MPKLKFSFYSYAVRAYICLMLFEKFAADYAGFRPDYPADLIESIVEHFRLDKNSLILDLACGTGNLTRQLQKATHGQVFGFDCSIIMLKHSRESRIACAKAEALPIKAALFDAIVVGQAFHWFEFTSALSEIRRALKPGGGLAIVYYWRKKPMDGHRLMMDKLVKQYNPGFNPAFMDYDWQKIISSHGGFDNIDNFATDCVYEYKIPDYLKLQRSKSYIGDAMPPKTLAKFMAEAETMLKSLYPDNIVPEKMQFYYVSAVKP
jgi:ubiquinone/menaquinone biosynthesis C-methylase UbiE